MKKNDINDILRFFSGNHYGYRETYTDGRRHRRNKSKTGISR